MRLVELATKSSDKINVELVVSALAADIVDAIGVDLATVWLLDSTLQSMTCICSEDAERERELEGFVLSRADYPTYFNKIFEDIGISSENVYQDKRLEELVEGYFKPNGVKSLLDFVIYDDDIPKAIICCETTREHRRWNEDDLVQIRKLTVLSSSLVQWH